MSDPNTSSRSSMVEPKASSDAGSSSKPTSKKPSKLEKVMSFFLDGPPGTRSAEEARKIREKWDEDVQDMPRTEQEERERQTRLKKRAEIIGGGDGVRTNDMQKEGWGGANLALSHA